MGPFTCDVQLVDDTGERQSKRPALLKSLPKLPSTLPRMWIKITPNSRQSCPPPTSSKLWGHELSRKNTCFKLDGEYKLLLNVSRNSGWKSLWFAACPFYPCFSVFLPHKRTLHNRNLTPLQLLRGL